MISVEKESMSMTVVAYIDNLFFSAKVSEVARRIGVPLVLTSTPEAAEEKARLEPPALLIADLNAAGDVPALAARLKNDPATKQIRLIGFYSHVQHELMERAKAAGFDLLLPRSAFVTRLAELLGEKSPF